jgi:hypothetical protein
VALAPTSNVCLRVEDPDDVQEEHRRFILVRAEECPTFSGGGESCIILHQNACSRGYKAGERGRSSQVSRCKWSVCVCDFVGALARSKRVICSSVLCLSCGTVPACSFYSLKEMQGYKILVCGVILVGGSQRPQEGLIRW